LAIGDELNELSELEASFNGFNHNTNKEDDDGGDGTYGGNDHSRRGTLVMD
jgi:hypothetical protein